MKRQVTAKTHLYCYKPIRDPIVALTLSLNNENNSMEIKGAHHADWILKQEKG